MTNNGMACEDELLERLVRDVLKSSKYRNICPDFVKNVGSRELLKRRNLKKAVKSTKNKLHQISGAYFLARPRYDAWLEELRKAKEMGDLAMFQKTCAKIMSYHYSTRERLKILPRFYDSIFSSLPPVHSVIDVACGLHPLAIPWMPLKGKAKYHAYDVYKDLMSFLDGYMSLAGVEGCAETRDILQAPPTERADLAFVLNTVPCLEQIEKSAGLKVLESSNADFFVVSFPVRSLGGKEKDMRRYYEDRFNELTDDKDWSIRRVEFETELVFLVQKKS